MLSKPLTVLGPSVDFSKLPYRDRATGLNVNGNTPYLSEEIVTPPFRGETLRLKRGVHLHWAMPDALTQGVNRRKASGAEPLEFRSGLARRERPCLVQENEQGRVS